ncbi:uncharacterized protein [Nerophis lumbriciformis]|uniref:uncharacterized protein n=1 Tax=Nerophis lumbriciformis TaxID=546530 RepID=UPI002AE06CF8|nr:coagulation factor V-like [Nerophis lumbriciformis]XP_061781250.1 coagulation factor V-like [Nerophis lumbriciformis]
MKVEMWKVHATLQSALDGNVAISTPPNVDIQQLLENLPPDQRERLEEYYCEKERAILLERQVAAKALQDARKARQEAAKALQDAGKARYELAQNQLKSLNTIQALQVENRALKRRVARDVGEGIVARDVGEGIVAPDVGEGIVAPDVGEGIVAPDVGEGIVAPDVGEGIVARDGGEGIVAPDGGEGIVARDGGEGIVEDPGDEAPAAKRARRSPSI